MVIRPKRILWPSDFSELSLVGGRYARALREHFGAELRIVHVVPPPLSPELSVMLPSEVPATVSEPEILAACRKGIQRLIAEHFAGDQRIIYEALFGSPWAAVCDYARQSEIDLIVLATRGRTGLRHALIGSTAERIVQHAPCPVLTVKSGERHFLAGEKA